MKKFLPLSACAGALLTIAHVPNAFAFDWSGNCGYSAPNWNAPRGAAVTHHSIGPISVIMDAISEYRTHVAMSHGTSGWVTHATTATPSQVVVSQPIFDNSCPFDAPLNASELASGYPGWSQTNLGGYYAFLYGGGSQPDYLAYQIPIVAYFFGRPLLPTQLDLGAAQGTADYAWYNQAYQWTNSQTTDAAGIYLLGTNVGTGFHHIAYSFNEYMANLHQYGIVCSTALASEYEVWQQSNSPNDLTWPRPPTSNHEYTKDQTINAGNNLWWAVYNDCMQQPVLGQHYPVNWTIASIAQCNMPQLCMNAAYQVLNCFVWGPDIYGSCGRTESDSWSYYVNNTIDQTGANSISPDYILGRSGYPSDTSVWAPYPDSPVQWSGAGNVYGCWN
jgi:hypothetical protein